MLRIDSKAFRIAFLSETIIGTLWLFSLRGSGLLVRCIGLCGIGGSANCVMYLFAFIYGKVVLFWELPNSKAFREVIYVATMTVIFKAHLLG